MTDPNYTALLLVVDRSGSMHSIRDEMVEALTTLVTEQAAAPGLLTVDLVQFDNQIDHVFSLADPTSVRIELEPRGGTALFDALGIAITEFGRTLAGMPEHARPSTVQVVVVTDGEENSSQEYSLDLVRTLVVEQSEKYGWDFVFLGANQDAVMTGRALGIDADSALTFEAAPDQIAYSAHAVSRYMTDLRTTGLRTGFTQTERQQAAEDES
ncbi:vWA domain-containing protein [Diaminobutyricimonas sp. LJ205]|uniref:vWA domain-containing protein n=1 Tax=Diaminobutyricimonas sp. LJ205 TaxID=2683590 RepID=UPI0012F4BA7E|nr:vWA domain-containing protein [Diaminobutyricimonas sp. LJ205]